MSKPASASALALRPCDRILERALQVEVFLLRPTRRPPTSSPAGPLGCQGATVAAGMGATATGRLEALPEPPRVLCLCLLPRGSQRLLQLIVASTATATATAAAAAAAAAAATTVLPATAVLPTTARPDAAATAVPTSTATAVPTSSPRVDLPPVDKHAHIIAAAAA